MSHYDVFISYRRGDGAEVARLVRYALMGRGVKAFLDVENLGSGHFDEKLLDTIASTPHFIIILSRDTLARCSDPEDWVRREILQAVDTGRNIVPILTDGFTFDGAALPEKLGVLQRHNGLKYNHEYFEAMIERLLEYLGHPKESPSKPAPASSPALSPDYVFLDFDGVLRPAGSEPYVFDKKCLRAFEAFMREHPPTKIVITSSWRLAMPRGELVKQFSPDIRTRVVGVTPASDEGEGPERHREILLYLRKNHAGDASWIAIDDDADRYRPGCRNVVLTDAARGFDAAAAAEIRSRLGDSKAAR